ncbi:MAG: hypothetical protein ABIN39_06750 [candidate division WOR-3 bacterium]
MNKINKTVFLILLTLLFSIAIFARPAYIDPKMTSGKIFDQRMLDINQINTWITNFAIFGQDVYSGNNSGLYWPAGFPQETYVFGAGVWVGGIIENDDGTADTTMSCGYYPNSASTEFVPGDINDASPDRPTPYTNPWDIVYISTSDNYGQPWPLKTTSGADSVVSMQDSYTEFNDMDIAYRLVASSKPLEIEVKQTTYAWVGPLKEDIIFIKYEIQNKRSDHKDIKKCYVGIGADNDIGNEAGTAANDLLGFIDTMTVDYAGVNDTLMQINVGYQFQLESEAGWTHFPGIVAYKYLESPRATEPIDLYHDGSFIIPAGERIGMTTFNYFTIQTDPSDHIKRYLVLAGYDHTIYNPNDPEASYRPFPTWGQGVPGYPGKTEDPTAKGDKRFAMASGPFTLKYDSTATVIIGIIISKNSAEMLNKMLIAQQIYDQGWLGPVAPGQVNFDVVGMDKKVIIYWDNAQELIPDKYYTLVSDPSLPTYNPAYREYDVEGYNVYRSRTGAGGTWELIGKFDKINEYTIVLKDSLIYYNAAAARYETTYYYDTVGSNTGIPYYFVDSNLTNGIQYYYTVRAYDVNFNGYAVTPTNDTIGAIPLVLEGAGKTKAAVPRALTSNLSPGTYSINFISGNIDTSLIKMEIIHALDTMIEKVKNDTFTLTFGLADSSVYTIYTPAYPYTITNKNGDIVIEDRMDLDTLWINNEQIIGLPSEKWNPYSGFLFKINSFTLDTTGWMNTSNSTFKVSVQSGTYDSSIMKAELAAKGRQFYHNSKEYIITWHEVVYPTLTVIGTDTFLPNDTNLTVTIFDVDNNIEIPYNSRTIGDNWHFNISSTALPSQNPKYLKSSSPNTVKVGLYFSNIILKFNNSPLPLRPMVWSSRPKDGDVWIVRVTPNDTAFVLTYPPINSSFKFTVTPATFTDVVKSTLDKIKVVPNPYVVRSELDLDYNYRRILFTNLPDKCTIRIYTLSGELIKTINHDVEITITKDNQTTTAYDLTKGYAEWDLLTKNDQIPAPGIYIYHVQTPNGETKIGKFAIIK